MIQFASSLSLILILFPLCFLQVFGPEGNLTGFLDLENTAADKVSEQRSQDNLS
jgi:hypothetical protein